MKILNFTFQFLLYLSLLTPIARAENITVPDKDQRQGMSYEEYSNYREKMRKHMIERRLSSDSPALPAEKTEKSNPNSSYGQGYHSRRPTVDRPENNFDNRPDRPKIERFNRGEMMRR